MVMGFPRNIGVEGIALRVRSFLGVLWPGACCETAKLNY